MILLFTKSTLLEKGIIFYEHTKTYTILVVEDEVPLLEAISRRLERNGFWVVTARSVDQAMNHLQDIEKVDIIWLDHYLLGGATGLEFLEKLKSSDSSWKNIPVFVVSNTAGADKVKTYMQLGVEKFFIKAEKRLDEIIDEIKKALETPVNNLK
ncbi:MAG: response regulator [bacterium]|nr:response regulator [bacterium]